MLALSLATADYRKPAVVPITVSSQEPKRTSTENLRLADLQLYGYDPGEDQGLGCPWYPASLKKIGNDAPTFSWGVSRMVIP